MRHEGLLTVRVHAPDRPLDGYFQWIRQPADEDLDGSERWYFDGSAMNAKWRELCTTGFGVVVTARSGTLLGFGKGVPPAWIRTAPAAEAWALAQIIGMLPEAPYMTTDCKSLLSIARRGSRSATQAKASLARIWCSVSINLDGDVRRLVTQNLLRWTPAHLSQNSIGLDAGDNGRPITAVDWRANRLADALAKQAASQHAVSQHTVRLVTAAEAAAKYAFALLGAVTWRANHHRVQVPINGELSWITKRDSLERPKPPPGSQSNTAKRSVLPKEVVHQPVEILPPPCRPSPCAHEHVLRSSAARRVHAHFRAVDEAAATRRVVEELASRLSAPAAQRLTAAERLAALRLRVREREAGW